jgi:hypothetical protein
LSLILSGSFGESSLRAQKVSYWPEVLPLLPIGPNRYKCAGSFYSKKWQHAIFVERNFFVKQHILAVYSENG